MNSVSEALNTLISAVNVAYNKGGVYSMEEAHLIYTAISYLNSLQNKPIPAPAPVDTTTDKVEQITQVIETDENYTSYTS